MKAWQVHQFCEPEQMTLEDVAIPEPGPGELRIRNRAAALNFFDILQVQGKYQVKPPFPFAPGAEVAGVIDAIGAGVEGFKPGDRVGAVSWIGGLAEYTIAKAERAFVIPNAMSDSEAAAMPVVYHTTYYGIEKRGQLQKDEWLLVHARASGVGMAAIQIGKALGAHVIATAGSDEKVAFCKTLSADFAFSYRDASWVDRVKEVTKGRGADVIYDPVGGEIFDLSTKIIATQGRLLVVGFASGRIPTIAANRILLKDIAIVGVHWGPYADRTPGYFHTVQLRLLELYERGAVKPVVQWEETLDNVPSAYRRMAERGAIGKMIVRISESD